MKITVASEEFSRILSRAQGVVDRRHSMAILTNVVLEAGTDEITVTGTDLEVSLRQTCAAKVENTGSVGVTARKLFEVVRESDAEEIVLESIDNQWVQVSYGRSTFKLMGIDPADHPGMPQTTDAADSTATVELDTADLIEMIGKTIFAVSSDDTRSNLAGVHLGPAEKKGIIRMVATDGHRLALIDHKVKGSQIKESVILPRKGLAELAKLLPEESGKVRLTLSEREAQAELSGCLLSMRLVEGTFPDYNQVVPKETPNRATVDRDALLHTVRRVSLLSNERARGVKFTLRDGALEISANNPDMGEAVEDLEVEYSGDDLEVGFNARYLLDVLAVLPEGSRVEIGLGDSLSPGVVRGENPDYRYVVMPMRI